MTAEALRILLVRPDSVADLEIAFRRRGTPPELRTAGSLPEAIAIVADGSLDAIVTFDLQDGAAVSRLIEVAQRQSPRTPIIAVAALSAEAEEALIAGGIAAVFPPDRADRIPAALRREVTQARSSGSEDRDRALLQVQLIQAQKMEALGTLAGGIAHDFNNILMGILGNAEMARDELADWHPVYGYLNEILRASYRARDVVQRILTFSRNREPNWQRISLGQVTDESIAFLRASLPTTLELVVRRAPEPPAIDGDPDQIRQVLVNLVANAAQAIGNVPGTVTIQEEVVDVGREQALSNVHLTERRYLTLAITDTGPGMDPETQARIFEPFFTTKPPGQGTGLGLAVVHGIMEEHGGAITVESEPGRGTTFRLFFPSIGMMTPMPGSVATAPRGNGQRVLLVDDEAAIVRIGRQMLERLDYQVTAVDSAITAIEVFAENPDDFELVVSDLTMPGHSGVDLAKQLKALNPSIRFILTTGHPEVLDHACPSGVDAMLSKPFAMAKLAMVIEQVLGTRAAP